MIILWFFQPSSVALLKHWHNKAGTQSSYTDVIYSCLNSFTARGWRGGGRKKRLIYFSALAIIWLAFVAAVTRKLLLRATIVSGGTHANVIRVSKGSDFLQIRNYSFVWIPPKLSAFLPAVTAGSLTFKEHSVCSSCFTKPTSNPSCWTSFHASLRNRR